MKPKKSNDPGPVAGYSASRHDHVQPMRDRETSTQRPLTPIIRFLLAYSSISWVELCCCHSNSPSEEDGREREAGGGGGGGFSGFGVWSVLAPPPSVLFRFDLCPLPPSHVLTHSKEEADFSLLNTYCIAGYK